MRAVILLAVAFYLKNNLPTRVGRVVRDFGKEQPVHRLHLPLIIAVASKARAATRHPTIQSDDFHLERSSYRGGAIGNPQFGKDVDKV